MRLSWSFPWVPRNLSVMNIVQDLGGSAVCPLDSCPLMALALAKLAEKCHLSCVPTILYVFNNKFCKHPGSPENSISFMDVSKVNSQVNVQRFSENIPPFPVGIPQESTANRLCDILLQDR